MIKNIASLIRRIVGRIKMNLTALSATLGVMSLPLGVYLIVEGGIGDRWLGYGLFIIGWLLLILAMWRVWIEEKKRKQEKEQRDAVDNNKFELQTHMLGAILTELRILNNRGGDDERNKKPEQ